MEAPGAPFEGRPITPLIVLAAEICAMRDDSPRIEGTDANSQFWIVRATAALKKINPGPGADRT